MITNFTGTLLGRLESLFPDSNKRRIVTDTKWGNWHFRIYYGLPILPPPAAIEDGQPIGLAWTAVGVTSDTGYPTPDLPEDFRCMSISYREQCLASWVYPTKLELINSVNLSFGATIIREFSDVDIRQ